jgi:hypothetical protein
MVFFNFYFVDACRFNWFPAGIRCQYYKGKAPSVIASFYAARFTIQEMNAAISVMSVVPEKTFIAASIWPKEIMCTTPHRPASGARIRNAHRRAR